MVIQCICLVMATMVHGNIGFGRQHYNRRGLGQPPHGPPRNELGTPHGMGGFRNPGVGLGYPAGSSGFPPNQRVYPYGGYRSPYGGRDVPQKPTTRNGCIMILMVLGIFISIVLLFVGVMMYVGVMGARYMGGVRGGGG